MLLLPHCCIWWYWYSDIQTSKRFTHHSYKCCCFPTAASDGTGTLIFKLQRDPHSSILISAAAAPVLHCMVLVLWYSNFKDIHTTFSYGLLCLFYPTAASAGTGTLIFKLKRDSHSILISNAAASAIPLLPLLVLVLWFPNFKEMHTAYLLVMLLPHCCILWYWYSDIRIQRYSHSIFISTATGSSIPLQPLLVLVLWYSNFKKIHTAFL